MAAVAAVWKARERSNRRRNSEQAQKVTSAHELPTHKTYRCVAGGETTCDGGEVAIRVCVAPPLDFLLPCAASLKHNLDFPWFFG